MSALAGKGAGWDSPEVFVIPETLETLLADF
jgi:hypothetical protein